ncbi:calcium/sodium antiporter [Reinekea thalattae]|uniref:Calcium/sodium antiporter n=1 Tax=Reinekea thalattae TaxID=2593301 RepID=A0A5C8Z4D4_9GAMM|nr:calcium/sodium antiporter [Reinekea thalattae]TXR52174.1 calcium/sodium antiporter [Reinekea thalattae]
MLMFSVAIIVGLIFLVLSADRFVAGSAAIANNFGVPHIIIGVTIVSLGTSAPEIIAAALMSLENRIDMALGNAIGSNIANIGLVLGVTALIAPIPVSKRLITNENLIMMAVSLAIGILLFNLTLAFYEGILLLAALVTFLAWIYHQNKTAEQPDAEFEEEIPNDMSTPVAILWFIVGLAVLIFSARALVWGAVGIANQYGISDAIIGATIIAIGTSLPELAASAMSAIKKHHDIAIGNILGSNIFNLLAVVAVPALLRPNSFSAEIFNRDYAFMLGISAVLFGLLIIQGRRGKSLGRPIGTIFVVMYGAYGYLAYQAAM